MVVFLFAAAVAATAAAGNPAAMVSQQQRPEFSTRAPTPGYPPPRGWNPMDGEPPMRPQCMLSVLSKYCQYVYINTLLQWLTLCDCHSSLILPRIILQPLKYFFMCYADPGVPGAPPPPGGQMSFMRPPTSRPRFPPRMDLAAQQAAMYRARNTAPPPGTGMYPPTAGRYPPPQHMVCICYDR